MIGEFDSSLIGHFMNRRYLFALGLSSCAAIASHLVGKKDTHLPKKNSEEQKFLVISRDDTDIIRSLAKCIINFADDYIDLVPEYLNEIVRDVDIAISKLPFSTQEEITQLLFLLRIPVSRLLLTGFWSSWDDIQPQNIEKFLSQWRDSKLNLLCTAYHGLHDLILASWYGNPKSWSSIHYPGPPFA